jgi:DNA-binding LacI/PurR family transcriptional regulator
VIGFDDVEGAEYWHLTTVRQPLFESGVVGCELLFEEMVTLPVGSLEVQEIVLDTRLIVRGTAAPPPG